MDPSLGGQQSEERAVVTGAGGFIGGHLVADLVDRGHDVRAVDVKPVDRWFQRHESADNLSRDLKEKDACFEVLEGAGEVYNLAADMGGMGFIENYKAECMLNVLINTHLLMAAREKGVDRYFYASSACVYNQELQDTPDVTPLEEGDAYPALPEDGYGWEKLFSERMCRHFHEDYGIGTRVARFHNVYGPLGTYDGGREKAPAALCRKVAKVKLGAADTVTIWGDGTQTRSFTWIDDCIEGIRRITRSDVTDPLNLGSDEMVTIDKLVDLIEKAAGVEVERDYDLSKPQGVGGRNSDNTKIENELAWSPSTSLREGIAETYAWIEDEVRKDLEGKREEPSVFTLGYGMEQEALV